MPHACKYDPHIPVIMCVLAANVTRRCGAGKMRDCDEASWGNGGQWRACVGRRSGRCLESVSTSETVAGGYNTAGGNCVLLVDCLTTALIEGVEMLRVSRVPVASVDAVVVLRLLLLLIVLL